MADAERRIAIKDWLWILQRIAVWAVFLGLFYWLRDFFLLIFLTFVFAYSGARAVNALQPRAPRVPRGALVCGVFVAFLGALVGLGFLVVPRVDSEIRLFQDQFPNYRVSVLRGLDDLRARYPFVGDALDRAIEEIDALRAQVLGGDAAASGPAGAPPAPALARERIVGVAVGWISGFAGAVVSGVTNVLLALVFAFLILIDAHTLRQEVEGFESSRVAWIYNEVRATLVEIGISVGSVLEAFAVISFVETLVIVAVLWVLGVPSLLLIGVVTFFLGLVPVVGQVAPALPIAWIAFAHGGMPLLVKGLVGYFAVRSIAGYTFEPRVFGSRFKLSTLLILVTLMVGFKAAGIWGMILGIPIAYSILRPRAAAAEQP